MRPKIVLYNPQAVFWTMPLALLAIASALDRDKYEVVIVDGRLEPPETVIRQLDDAFAFKKQLKTLFFRKYFNPTEAWFYTLLLCF